MTNADIITAALDAAETAAEESGIRFTVKRTNDAILLGRRLSRGRWQRVGSVAVREDRHERVHVRWESVRVRSAVRDVAEAAEAVVEQHQEVA